eukprot:Rmarinus@m.23246
MLTRLSDLLMTQKTAKPSVIRRMAGHRISTSMFRRRKLTKIQCRLATSQSLAHWRSCCQHLTRIPLSLCLTLRTTPYPTAKPLLARTRSSAPLFLPLPFGLTVILPNPIVALRTIRQVGRTVVLPSLLVDLDLLSHRTPPPPRTGHLLLCAPVLPWASFLAMLTKFQRVNFGLAFNNQCSRKFRMRGPRMNPR